VTLARLTETYSDQNDVSAYTIHVIESVLSGRYRGGCSVPEAAHVKILDFGCGDGNSILAFLRAGFDAFGCDVQESEVEKARDRLAKGGFPPDRIRLIRGGVTTGFYPMPTDYRLPFETGTFDVILSDQVFEHLEGLDLAAAGLRRILKDDGVIFSRFPSLFRPIEPHLNLPFVHWIPHSRLREALIRAAYRLGFGCGQDMGPAHQNDYLKYGVFYRTPRRWKFILGEHFRVRSDSSLQVHAVNFARKRIFSMRTWFLRKFARTGGGVHAKEFSLPFRIYLTVRTLMTPIFDEHHVILEPHRPFLPPDHRQTCSNGRATTATRPLFWKKRRRRHPGRPFP
jgi:SAM-dependent methyltransferase